MRKILCRLVVPLVVSLLAVNGFAPPITSTNSQRFVGFIGTGKTQTSALESSSNYDDDDAPTWQDNLQLRWQIFQDSQAKGYDLKQCLTMAIAGEYDIDATKEKLDSLINSAGCVMFIWQSSPSCKQAIAAMEVAGADVKLVKLDEPWDEGNKIRAEISKLVGRSSVPAIFIGGTYVGGYDGGVSKDAPGVVDLAFQGKLRPLLEDAGVL